MSQPQVRPWNVRSRSAFRHAEHLSSKDSVTIYAENLHEDIISSNPQVAQGDGRAQAACAEAMTTNRYFPVPPSTPRKPQSTGRVRARIRNRIKDTTEERPVEPRNEAEEPPCRVRMRLLLAQRAAEHFEFLNQS